MTDKPPPLSTQNGAPSQNPPNPLPITASVFVQDAPQKPEAVDEEPYTIKCICGFSDDDGNTIYCDTCDTWQHIECYYPNNVEDALREDFSHSCVDCKPRMLDRQQAVERQRARTAMPAVEEATDKKAKRPPSKSHKKKPKPTELQLNGHASSDNTKHANPHEHPQPPKKAKTSHKSAHSISSQAPKRSPSYGTTSRVNGHPPSPVSTPPDLPKDFEIHDFSLGFHSLVDDSSVQIVHNNSFANVTVTNTLSEWLRDHDKLKRDVNREPDEIFQKMPKNIDSQEPPVEVEQTTRTVSLPAAPGYKEIPWQRLRAVSAIPKDVPLMELNGNIGFQSVYCADPENRYDHFSSPLPFVLFHPQLPIYVDTRREGSQARYVRRSCRPNATLETYLSDAREYHFWLVSDRQIAAEEQITIQWDFRFPNDKKARMLRVLGLNEEDANTQPEPVVEDAEYQQIDAWLRCVLSEYGGCACDLGSECAFARFHRNYIYGKTQKARKPKGPQHTISPTSTGHATNSRAPSEGRLEDVPEQDRRSVSDSSRSKPPSRDMTPTARQGSFDTLGILTEPTDRDKRKVAMVEDSFRRMEQQQPPRKKKRISDGTSSSKSKSTGRGSATQIPYLSNGVAERRYIDAGTSRSKSGSPTSTGSPRTITALSSHPRSRYGSAPMASRKAPAGPRPSYCDVSTQTDEEIAAWYKEERPTTPQRKVTTLAKRLFSNRHHCRPGEGEGQMRQSVDQPTPMDIDSPVEQKASLPSPSLAQEPSMAAASESPVLVNSDLPMPDAPVTGDMKPPTGPLGISLVKTRSPELRVQMPPPAFSGSPTSVGGSATTPSSAGGLMVQSPSSTAFPQTPYPLTPNGSVVANPSPVKKKMSLSDYRNRRSAAATKPSLDSNMPKSAGSDDPKSASSDVKIESPTAEKVSEVLIVTNASI
ncbi:hypothetical protein GQ53DRAFT_868534 [Thozetella sp. PMI_491]|nr:hypothetical protein GQ53DRAFT_868534 [Thozetella sp. PMI_491]